MYFFSLLCVFATMFIVAQSYDYTRATKFNDYITKVEQIQCKAVRQGITETMRSSICAPRYRHVRLSPRPSQEFQPSVVSVRRCDGNCPGHTCMPVKIKMIKVPVGLTTRSITGELDFKCAMAEVEEHTKCSCACKQKAHECTRDQVFLEEHCACICRDEEYLKRECETNDGLWDSDTCRCECHAEYRECSSGLKWNSKQCRCA